jgi:phospholipid-binding lipoprotein MlaA
VAALLAVPAQPSPDQSPAPTEQSVPAEAPTPPAVPVEAAPPSAPPAENPPAADNQTVPELSDPLSDPASATAAAQPPLHHAKDDPLEGFNRAMFGIHQGLDKVLYRPAAMGYKHVVPKPVRSGLRNFFSNLTEPLVFANYILQLRVGKAMRTFARFTVNSTLGVGGLVDVAKTKRFNTPHVTNSLGDTFAYYGMGPGPYLFIPLLGPTTLRDVFGGPMDAALLPVIVGVPFNKFEYQVTSGVLIGLDKRAEVDPELRSLFEGAVDPYATLRSVWLQNRAAEVEALRQHKDLLENMPELETPLTDPGKANAVPPPTSNTPELKDPLEDPAAAQPAPSEPAPATP